MSKEVFVGNEMVPLYARNIIGYFIMKNDKRFGWARTKKLAEKVMNDNTEENDVLPFDDFILYPPEKEKNYGYRIALARLFEEKEAEREFLQILRTSMLNNYQIEVMVEKEMASAKRFYDAFVHRYANSNLWLIEKTNLVPANYPGILQ